MTLEKINQGSRRLIKRAINSGLNAFGLQISRVRMQNDPMLRLMAALKHFEIDSVIDVGANIGQFAEELLERGYKGQIHSVEPLPDAHKVLAERSSKHANWHAMQRTAVGCHIGSIEITVAGNSESSSILEMLDRHIEAAPRSAPLGKITVPISTLDGLFSSALPTSARSLLKIDAQGYEHQILQGAPQLLSKVQLVLLELSLQELYRDQKLWLEMIAFMRERRFDVWTIQPDFSHPKSGQLFQVNGLFFRAEQLTGPD